MFSVVSAGLIRHAERPLARRNNELPGASNKCKFVCVICGAAYSHVKSLISHLHYHTGETECHKTHVTRHLMVKHGVNTPRSNSGEKRLMKDSWNFEAINEDKSNVLAHDIKLMCAPFIYIIKK